MRAGRETGGAGGDSRIQVADAIRVGERRSEGASLPQKIKDALDETRILVLGGQILVGFAYRGVFQPGFERLPTLLKATQATALGLMLIVLTLLLLPGAYHEISEQGEDTGRLRELVSRIAGLALLPFAAALGASLTTVTAVVLPGPGAAAVGGGALLAALTCWYGIEYWVRRDRPAEEQLTNASHERERAPTKLEDKIQQVLTEARVILPGAQALLGFQFITILSDSFSKLPASSQYVHVGSMLAVALTTIFLMTPAAYHRLVEDGEATERFQRFSSRMVLLSLGPLAVGLCGDFYVVLYKVSQSRPLAAGIAGLQLAAFLGVWFGLTYALRLRYRRPRLVRATAG
jgi:hypothetical protein